MGTVRLSFSLWQALQPSARLSTSWPRSPGTVEKVIRPSLLKIRTCAICACRPMLSMMA